MPQLIGIGAASKRTGLGRDRLKALLDRSLCWARPLGIRLGERRDRFFYEEALEAYLRGEKRAPGDLTEQVNAAMRRAIRSVKGEG